jgi:hypothetical protein
MDPRDAAPADLVIASLLASFVDTGPEPPPHARAALVLDAGCEGLKSHLEDRNFRAIVAAGDLAAPDPEPRRAILGHRALVTRRTAPFLDLAPIDEFSIVGLDALPIDVDGARAAELVSRAFRTHALRWTRASWLLLVHPEERHAFRWLG